MELQLDGIARRVARVAFTPIVADSVREDVAVFAECRGGDAAANLGVAFEAVLSVLVPEVEGAVATGSAEGTVLWVEGYSVYGVDFGYVACGGVLLAVAFEGEVEAVKIWLVVVRRGWFCR